MNRAEMLRRLKAGEDPLELSIEKWQDIVDGKGRNSGAKNCALCEALHCGKCSVSDKTGLPSCEGTPYMEFVLCSTKSERLRCAKEELEFLKSLRKKEEMKSEG